MLTSKKTLFNKPARKDMFAMPGICWESPNDLANWVSGSVSRRRRGEGVADLFFLQPSNRSEAHLEG